MKKLTAGFAIAAAVIGGSALAATATMRDQDETDNVKAWLEAETEPDSDSETEPDSGGREPRTSLYMAFSGPVAGLW
jgi:hypothetical protein